MVTIVDYEAGNLTSVKRALDNIGEESIISADPETIIQAERIIFPGVGHAQSAMKSLLSRGIKEALNKAFDSGTPIMGICLGTQIILSHSEEGDVDTLDLIPGTCVKFNLKDKDLTIPHMGWNSVKVTQKHFILKDLKHLDELYFVHSYYPAPSDATMSYAETEYEITFTCAMGYKNLFATQFHPEKSGPLGLQILKNFTEWDVTDVK